MPTPIGHSLAGAIIYALATKRKDLLRSWRWLLLSMFFASVADVDFAPGLFGRLDLANRFHRRLTHTLLFSILASALTFVVLKVMRKPRPARNSIMLLGCGLSHIVLDMAGKDFREPLGVPFLWPLVRKSFKSSIELFADLRKSTYAEIFSIYTLGVVACEVVLLGAILSIVVALKLRHAAKQRQVGKCKSGYDAAPE